MDKKIVEEFKKWMANAFNQWVTADEAFEAGYKARDEQVVNLRDAIIWAINHNGVVETDGIFNYLSIVIKELDK